MLKTSIFMGRRLQKNVFITASSSDNYQEEGMYMWGTQLILQQIFHLIRANDTQM